MIRVEYENGESVITGYSIRLRPITHADLEQLRSWRNDPDIAGMMHSRQRITPEQQQSWFETIKTEPTQKHWVVEYKGQAIGATNIKSPDAQETVARSPVLTPGLYIGKSHYRGNIVAFAPTLALYDYCFECLCATTLIATVHAENAAALNYNRQLGYKVCKQDAFVHLSLQKEVYYRQTDKLKNVLSRNRVRRSEQGE